MPKQPRAGRKEQYRRLLRDLYNPTSGPNTHHNKPRSTEKPVTVPLPSNKLESLKDDNNQEGKSKVEIDWKLVRAELSQIIYPFNILKKDPRRARIWRLKTISIPRKTYPSDIPVNDPRRNLYRKYRATCKDQPKEVATQRTQAIGSETQPKERNFEETCH